MKERKFIFFVLLVICYCCTAVRFKEAKPKVVKLDKQVYIAETEVSNQDYRAFLQYLATNGEKEKYAICLYDSTKWQTAVSNADALMGYYHRHPAYNEYPIVNISKAAMDYYCEWLTLTYKKSRVKMYKKVVFRLPTENEYRKLMAVLPEADKCNVAKKENTSTDKKQNSSVNQSNEMPAPVNAYRPNKLGVYNLIGNVSEVSHEGKILGGNFTTPFEECGLGNYQQYTLPDARVGFRYVMEIIEF